MHEHWIVFPSAPCLDFGAHCEAPAAAIPSGGAAQRGPPSWQTGLHVDARQASLHQKVAQGEVHARTRHDTSTDTDTDTATATATDTRNTDGGDLMALSRHQICPAPMA
jgi:hypothetical protein